MSRLLRLSVLSAISVWASLNIPTAFAGKPKTPKMAVQLYGVDISYNPGPVMAFYTTYLILSDGSHALASCGEPMAGPLCKIEAFVTERE